MSNFLVFCLIRGICVIRGKNMGQSRRKARGNRLAARKSPAAVGGVPVGVVEGPIDAAVRYAEACGSAAQGKHDEARRIYAELEAGWRMWIRKHGYGR